METVIEGFSFTTWARPEVVNIVGEDTENIRESQGINWLPQILDRAKYKVISRPTDNPFVIWEEESLEWIHNAFDLVPDSWPDY